VSFGVLGNDESCCGDQARKMGGEDTYQELRNRNIALMQNRKVNEIIVSSPHCLQIMNTDYTSDLSIRVWHYTQLLYALVKKGRLSLPKPVQSVVTYHDPCYLGRHAGEYEAPRRLLNAIEGLQLVEMPRNRENSLCCGGGGGGLWMDVPQEQRFAVLRVQEAQQVGAKVIATACPYCTSMLEDAVKTLNLEEAIEIRDIAELLAQATGWTGR